MRRTVPSLKHLQLDEASQVKNRSPSTGLFRIQELLLARQTAYL